MRCFLFEFFFVSGFFVRFFLLVFIVLSYERVSGGSTVYDFFRELLFRSFRKTPASFALLSFCHLLFGVLFSFVFFLFFSFGRRIAVPYIEIYAEVMLFSPANSMTSVW